MKVLVLATDYPSEKNKTTLMYIHVRNKYYSTQNIDVTVLNFRAECDYFWEDIKVITHSTYEKEMKNEKFDLLIAHAPNIRNHFLFLKKYEKHFSKIVFCIHGHEVLKINKVYPKPYKFIEKKQLIRVALQDLYDTFKLKIWKRYFGRIIHKSHFIFVSKWLYNAFLYWTRIEELELEGNFSIIYNSIGKIFEENSYNTDIPKKYDFITIRSSLDNSTYCIDLVYKLAKKNPNYKFLVIGKGNFFKYYHKPENITLIQDTLQHNQIVEYLNISRCGLMLTRHDTHGVMASEIASFGMPLITSNIEICNEVFKGFNNVELVKNDNIENVNLNSLLKKFSTGLPYQKVTKFFAENTVEKEVQLFYKLIS